MEGDSSGVVLARSPSLICGRPVIKGKGLLNVGTIPGGVARVIVLFELRTIRLRARFKVSALIGLITMAAGSA